MKREQMYANGQPIEPEIDLSGYVEKESGKGLSEHDFSTDYKEKIDSVEERAQRNTVTGIKGAAETTYRTGDINITKDNMGLGNVENKSSKEIRQDMTKEDVTNALQYTPEIEGAYENATAYTNTKIAELINGAPETLDTLKEVADAIQENKTVADALDAAIGKKAGKAELDTHAGNETIHIIKNEREKWNKATEISSATTEKAGLVKPDGNTIIAGSDGTLSTQYTKTTAIPANADLNDYKNNTGFFACYMTKTAMSLLNCPTSNAFFMIVGMHAGTYQEIIEYTNKPKRFMRNYYAQTGWSNWYQVYTTADPPPATDIIKNVTGITDSAEVSDSNVLASSAAVHQVFQSVSEGKRIIASAITGRGITTAADATFGMMADNIGSIVLPTGNATAAQVLAGRTFSNTSAAGITGTMTNRGAVSTTLNAGGTYTIPAGYHNGSGKVTVNSLASQTTATAVAANITSGKTAWVNGTKITGTGADNTAHYNAGITAADARANPASANYKTGYNKGVADADGRANAASVNYKTGYNTGVTEADARANPASTNYKAGYSAGYSAKVNGSLTKRYLADSFVTGTTTYNIASITSNYRTLNINNFGYEAAANTTAYSGSISTSGNNKTAGINMTYNASTGILTVAGETVQLQTSFLITTTAQYKPYVLL